MHLLSDHIFYLILRKVKNPAVQTNQKNPQVPDALTLQKGRCNLIHFEVDVFLSGNTGMGETK